MLILTRKKSERVICIVDATGEIVVIEVLESKGGRVKLGFTAPDSVKIRRAELSPLKPVNRLE